MREYSCETLIIGAGLAGATLGFLLRQAGKDVLMLELLDVKEKDKLCGGLMTGRTVLQFDEIFGQASERAWDPGRRGAALWEGCHSGLS
ncbi:MAG: FAD-dependent monooxygenase [Lachnospiraceae bacterium]|nr:FAD-dependent monooxygenase [Lachnospiraceae bacterium]